MGYPSCRQLSVEFECQTSKLGKIEQGVSQDDVRSIYLFNFYISKLTSSPKEVSLISYVKDSSIMIFGQDFVDLYPKVNCHRSHFFRTR